MTVLIVGGSKSGKSDFAQETALRLAQDAPHYYVATLINSGSDADKTTIASHLQRRAGMGFETVEQGRDILACLERTDPDGTFLLDSVTTLLTNALYPPEAGYARDDASALQCARDLMTFIRTVKHCVVVSDDLFRESSRYDEDTEAFRRHLGQIHCALARECDVVMEMAFGSLLVHKGEWE